MNIWYGGKTTVVNIAEPTIAGEIVKLNVVCSVHVSTVGLFRFYFESAPMDLSL